MSKCTAPIQGHRTASGAANCPVCSNKSYSRPSYSQPVYNSRRTKSVEYVSHNTMRGSRPRWSSSSSLVSYSHGEVRALTPIRNAIEAQGVLLDRCDIFLCHAWADRNTTAMELCELLEREGISVWFSEKSVMLGSNLMREIDRGLARSRAGLVLATESFVARLKAEGVADKELSALLARDLLVPIVHGITYEQLREESPLLASRSGLDTAENSMEEIALKIRELVTMDSFCDG